MVIRCHRDMKNFQSNKHHRHCHLFMMCKRVHTQDCQFFFHTKCDTHLLGMLFFIKLSSPGVNTIQFGQVAFLQVNLHTSLLLSEGNLEGEGTLYLDLKMVIVKRDKILR